MKLDWIILAGVTSQSILLILSDSIVYKGMITREIFCITTL